MRLSCMRFLSGAALAVTTGWTSASAIQPNWIDKKLEEFNSNPKAFMNDSKNVEKYDPNTLQPAEITPYFTKEKIDSGDFLHFKDQLQQSSKAHRKQGRAPIQANDRPENLVDELRFTRLHEMEQNQLTTRYLPTTPWSDDYWPIYKGIVANRYADSHFFVSDDWRTNANYLATQGCSVDELSPAEKYDLLIGDNYWTLKNKMLNTGLSYYNSTGYVEKWMGICHGWAPAAYMFNRPSQAIVLIAADGHTPIRFYPSDIKALASLLWANASPKARFIGGRCEEKHPQEDENGHVINPDCFDTNPGTWHQAVVNQIGVSQRSFIMDASYDYEVWNQPIYGYSYSYFNPSTFRSVQSLQEATVQRVSFSNDRFARYRSKNTAYITGIAMKVVYISETSPSHSPIDSPKQDRKVAVNYLYDLELDSNFNIIGGEWYHRQHPDFLWGFSIQDRAISDGDRYIDQAMGRPETLLATTWDPRYPVPSGWLMPAQKSSARGQPLAKIIETMVVLSQLAWN